MPLIAVCIGTASPEFSGILLVWQVYDNIHYAVSTRLRTKMNYGLQLLVVEENHSQGTFMQLDSSCGSYLVQLV